MPAVLTQLLDCGDPKCNMLYAAAALGEKITCEYILSGASLDLNHQLFGGTALHFALTRSDSDEIVQCLLENGCDPSKCDSAGNTPLMIAAREGLKACAQNLILGGANVNDKVNGRTALYFTLIGKKPEEMLHCLLETGCDPSKCAATGFTPLMIAAGKGLRACAEELVSRGVDVNFELNGQTALHMALCCKNDSIVKLLVENGCDVLKPDRSGMPPLVRSSCQGMTASVQCLLDNGVDANIEFEGKMLLMLSTESVLRSFYLTHVLLLATMVGLLIVYLGLRLFLPPLPLPLRWSL